MGEQPHTEKGSTLMFEYTVCQFPDEYLKLDHRSNYRNAARLFNMPGVSQEHTTTPSRLLFHFRPLNYYYLSAYQLNYYYYLSSY